MDLLAILRQNGAQPVIGTLNVFAKVQREEALKALHIFAPAAVQTTIESKEDYYNMSKEQKTAWQRAKEAERRRLNKEAGIDGNKLLTKENVERWRAEGKTFAAIARDYIGCPDYVVSGVLKDAPTIKRVLIKAH